MASSSSKSFSGRWTYDVFLSFRGEDTRKNFTDHLYSALARAGIFTFRDDEGLERGEEIIPELMKAIEESRLSIVILSENYATSTWCLRELVKILECRRTKGQDVVPVFYKVDPSQIRRQTGRTAEAFARLEVRFAGEMDKVQNWRAALTEIANLSGLVLDGGDYEAVIINNIVKEVLSKVDSRYMHVAKHPVGLASSAHKIKSLLSIGSDDVRMVGIYGMGGVGKTTIAKAVYNDSFVDFDGSCFIENVREASEQHNGIVRLQKQILCEILKTEHFKVRSTANGVSCLKKRLCSKKVLIILDDLDKLSQVDLLAGQCDWFGPGSRIIMTTRDKRLLKESKIDLIYEAKELKYRESLKLFSLHAFKKDTPDDDYLGISEEIVAYAGGLPLALEVLGSYLNDRAILEWTSVYDKLQRTLDNRIQAILRISYDGLGDGYEQDIFLDIACFFVGMDKDYAITILNSCGFFSEIGITDLINRCLLTIDRNKLMMHNLMRDMGRKIVEEESRKDPGKRSRLWFNEDILNVLRKHKGTEAIEGVVPALPLLNEKPINIETFETMHSLRLLQINYVHLTGSLGHLPKELKWLSWQHCPLNELPSDFLLGNLVVLDLQYSSLTCVWQGIKFLKNLKILNLSHCSFLKRTPDFTEVRKLETLYMNGCTSLFEFDPSIGLLNNLSYLNLEDCKKLKELPGCICELKSLKHLNLNGCSNLEKLPENLHDMECLSELSANGTALKQLPKSLGHLQNLTSLSLVGCNKIFPAESLPSPSPSSGSLVRAPVSIYLPASVSSLSSLRRLDLSDCNLSDGDILTSLQSLSTLQRLCLDGNNFLSLPSTVGQLPKLEILSVDKCRSLQSLPEFSPKLVQLHANGCISMEKLPNLSDANKYLHLYLMNCHRLTAIQGLENLNSVRLIAIEGCSDLATTFGDSFFQGYHELAETSDMYLTRRDIPDWFNQRRMGSSISFDIPPFHAGEKFLWMTLWIVYEGRGDGPVMTHSPEATIVNRTNGVELRYSFPLSYGPHNPGRHSWVCYIPVNYLEYPIRGGEEMEVSFEINHPLEVKQCGIHLVYKPNIEEDDQGQFLGVNGDDVDHETPIFLEKKSSLCEHFPLFGIFFLFSSICASLIAVIWYFEKGYFV